MAINDEIYIYNDPNQQKQLPEKKKKSKRWLVVKRRKIGLSEERDTRREAILFICNNITRAFP